MRSWLQIEKGNLQDLLQEPHHGHLVQRMQQIGEDVVQNPAIWQSDFVIGA